MRIIDLYEGNAWEGGADGYIVKAGQGQREYNWRTHVANADREGKPWGLYWVSDSRYSPESHKAAIKAAFPTGHFGVLGLWIDIEKPYIGMTDAAYRQTPYPYYKPVESLWRGVFQHTGVYPGLYFGPGTWDLIMGGTPKVLQQEFAQKCDCWIAHYTYAPLPDMRGEWVSWAMWQYQGEPDYNQVNSEWWERVTGLPVPTPPQPPTGGSGMYEATVKVYKLNVRSDHVADAIDLGDMVNGQKVTGDLQYVAPNGEKWLRIPWGSGVAWIATYFGGQDFCTVVDLGGTPPPPVSIHKTIELIDDGVVWKGTLTRQ